MKTAGLNAVRPDPEEAFTLTVNTESFAVSRGDYGQLLMEREDVQVEQVAALEEAGTYAGTAEDPPE